MMDLHAFDGGFCRQCLGFIDRRSWRWVRFHAVFWAFRHPTRGWVLIDTGYGGRFREATQSWPYWVYRYATPATMNGTASDALRADGIAPEEIEHVIVTHFHADHIGGLAEFSGARIHYRADALTELARLSPWQQVKSAFLPRLVPSWLPERSDAIARERFTADDRCGFLTYDLFGDGTVFLIDLPGHAPGQVGVWWPEEQVCYVADAFWRESQLESDRELLGLARTLQWNPTAYRNTLNRLRAWHRSGGVKLIACHSTTAEGLLQRRVARV
jgi:glyoxylase-like metal-dependent hydrolase (beta-lactamase superfamily II)